MALDTYKDIIMVSIPGEENKFVSQLVFYNKTTHSGRINIMNGSIEKEFTPNSTSIWNLVSQIAIKYFYHYQLEYVT